MAANKTLVRVGIAVGVLGALAGFGLAALYLLIVRDLPDLRALDDYRPALTSRVYDRNGVLIGEFFEERRELTPMAKIPELVVNAFLAAEDDKFYEHSGVDFVSMLRAAAVTLFTDETQGASTITQQLAKNLFLTRERSLNRKLQELALSFLLEATLGKDRILEIYLNIIEWGPGLYGLRPAARHYFEKEPQALTPRESAFLVALIPGPVKYQRSFANGELTPGFETLVENLLVKLRSVDALSEDEYQAALAQTLALRGKLSDPEAGEDGKPSLSAEPLAPTPHRLK